jgi:hypothetical protein
MAQLRNVIGRQNGVPYIFHLDEQRYKGDPVFDALLEGSTYDEVRMCYWLRRDIPNDARYDVPYG